MQLLSGTSIKTRVILNRMSAQSILTSVSIAYLILVHVSTRSVSAQTEYDSLITTARTFSYEAKFHKAEELFKRATQLSPARGDGYLGLAQIHLWLFLGTNDRSEYDTFNHLCDRSIDVGKKALAEDREDFRADYTLGETYLLRTIAEAMRHSYLNSFLAIRAAYGYLRQTLKSDPHFYDAYRGIGEIHYYLDMMPGSVKWILPITGLFADRRRGFEEIRLAYLKGTVDKVKSAFSLAQVYSNYVAEYDSAEILLRGLVKEFPDNPMFNYHLAVVLIKERNLTEAQSYLDGLLNRNDPRFALLNNLSLFLEGDVYFKMNDFPSAIKYNLMFLSKSKNPEYKCLADYRLAFSYRMLGDSALMKKYMIDARNGNHDTYDDSFAAERCKFFLANGISNDQAIMIEMGNDLAAGKYDKVYRTLLALVNGIRDRRVKSEGFITLADAAIRLGKYAEGARFARSAASSGDGVEKWVRARAWYLIALGSFYTGDRATSRKYLKKVEGTSQYGKDETLSALTNNLRRKLGR